MHVPHGVVTALREIPERPTGTITLHYGMQTPKWTLVYEQHAQFLSLDKALAYMDHTSRVLLVPKMSMTLTRRQTDEWRVSYFVRRPIEVE